MSRLLRFAVNSLEELHEIYKEAVDNEEAVQLITDNSLTMFNGVKTDTCLSIGYRDDIDKITGHLPRGFFILF